MKYYKKKNYKKSYKKRGRKIFRRKRYSRRKFGGSFQKKVRNVIFRSAETKSKIIAGGADKVYTPQMLQGNPVQGFYCHPWGEEAIAIAQGTGATERNGETITLTKVTCKFIVSQAPLAYQDLTTPLK